MAIFIDAMPSTTRLRLTSGLVINVGDYVILRNYVHEKCGRLMYGDDEHVESDLAKVDRYCKLHAIDYDKHVAKHGPPCMEPGCDDPWAFAKEFKLTHGAPVTDFTGQNPLHVLT
jgi:hypothetical protein